MWWKLVCGLCAAGVLAFWLRRERKERKERERSTGKETKETKETKEIKDPDAFKLAVLWNTYADENNLSLDPRCNMTAICLEAIARDYFPSPLKFGPFIQFGISSGKALRDFVLTQKGGKREEDEEGKEDEEEGEKARRMTRRTRTTRKIIGYDYSEKALKILLVHAKGEVEPRLVNLNAMTEDKKQLHYHRQLEHDLQEPADILLVRILEYLEPCAAKLLVTSLFQMAPAGTRFWFDTQYPKEPQTFPTSEGSCVLTYPNSVIEIINALEEGVREKLEVMILSLPLHHVAPKELLTQEGVFVDLTPERLFVVKK